ncbi:MAG TPA: hypothetical protein VL361_07510 [Candidatus Limnocylindrales bacterium]|nr:hypothetical protein [Candidatus Limnocylindrales bacterium]
MSTIHPFLAQDTLPIDVVSAPWQKMDATTRDILIILGAVALVTLVVLLWAVAFRSKRRRRHHHHHHHHSHSHTETTAETSPESEPVEESGSRRKRRRHRRREHRPRNPTLAETGGLPPLRSAPPPEP